MRRLLFAVTLLLLAAPARGWTVRTGHPKFLMNTDTLTALQARWPGQTTYTYFYNRARRELAVNAQWGNNSWGNAALAVAISQNANMIDSLNYRVLNNWPATETQCRTLPGRVEMLGFYDWAYDQLSTDSRARCRNKAWTLVNDTPEGGSPAYQHNPEWIIPFIFYGDYGSTPVDSNAVMLQACLDNAAEWEAAATCYDEVYGPEGGMSYYTGYTSMFGCVCQDVLERTCIGYDGSATSLQWDEGVGRYFVHQNRSDMALMRPQGRWNEDTATLHYWGPYVYNRKGLTWVWEPTNTILTTYTGNSDWGNMLTAGVLWFNPSPGAYPDPSTETRVYSNEVFGRVFWRDSWDMYPSTSAAAVSQSSQVSIFCGPQADPELVRWAGTFTLRRGVEDMIYQCGKWYSTDGDQHNEIYIPSTTAANGFHVIDPTEHLGTGWTNDGGQIQGSATSYLAHFPDCGAQARWAGELDTLPRDAALDLGVICNMDSAYSAKVTYARRGFRIPTAGWMVLQTVASLSDTFNAWEGFNTVGKPSFPSATWDTLLGGVNGGIYQTDVVSYADFSRDSASCYIYPVYSSATAKTRLVGGQSISNEAWQQNLSAGEINSVSTADSVSYECWMGDETTGTNRPLSTGVASAEITGRNSYTSAQSNKALDWHLQTWWPNASGTLRAITLIQWGDDSDSVRAVSATVNGSGVDISVDGDAAVFIHEPYLTTAGYPSNLTSLTVNVPYVATAYLYGFEAGNYTATHGATVLEVSAANGNLVFSASATGEWAIAQAGAETPTGKRVGKDRWGFWRFGF